MPNRLSSVLLAAALSLAPGCASQLSRVRGENTRLTSQVGSLRAEVRDDQATIRDLQNQVFVLKDQLETAQVAAGKSPGAMPKLPVEVLGPSASAPADPPPGDSDLGDAADLGDGARVIGVDDDGTEIVYVGDAAAGKVATPDPEPDRRVPDRIAPARDVPKVSTVSTASSRAVDAYQAAVDLLRGGDHPGAVAALRDFLRRFPEHDYADNAQYWLGEAFYDQKDYRAALAEFRRTVERYPKGNKVPDALLKMGFSYAGLGQIEQARATLEQVVSIYPRSGPARLAADRLGTLGK